MRSKAKTSTKVIIGFEIVLFILLVSGFFRYPLECFVLIVILLYDLKRRADVVIIENDRIIIKNWISFERRTYSLNSFDKAVLHFDENSSFGKEDVYLLKNEVIFSRVAGKNFENLRSLVEEINKAKLKTESNQ